MIKIDPSYDVVLTYSPIIEITGHIFECFDYYLFLRQYCKAGILLFGNFKKDKLKIAFESKYIVPFSDIEDDIMQIDSFSTSQLTMVLFNKKTKVILTDGNIKSLEYNRIFLACSKLYGFMCTLNDDYYNSKKNIVYLQDYRVHGKNKDFMTIDYVKKLPFKFYKKSNRKYDNTGMMYVTYNCRKITPLIVEQFHMKSKCSKTLLIVPYKLQQYDNIKDVHQVIAPVEDFFNQFDVYIYTPVARLFDCSPRLVTECFMQNKKVFKELDYFDIGLETRYNDCLNNIQSLDLNTNDDILKILEIKT